MSTTIFRPSIRFAAARFERLTEKAVDASVIQALNRTASAVRVSVARDIKQRYHITQRTAKKQMRVSRATRSRWFSQVIATGESIPLIQFAARARLPWNVPGRKHRRRGGGVSYEVTRGNREFSRHWFIATMPNPKRPEFGHTGVFWRDKEGKIHQQFGPSVPGMFLNKTIEARMRKLANATFNKNLAHEFEWRASRG